MKVLSTDGLTKLIQLVKSAFVKVEDVIETQEVTLADVALSGDYDDLINKPTIPTATSQLTNDSGFITSAALTGYATESYVNAGLSTKQDIILDLATIRSGAALGATAVQPSDLATVATSGSYSDLTNIPTNLLKNTATASSALTISGIATDKNGAINIGTSSQATGSYGVSIGAGAYANGSLALGLGYSARATANYAIQLGQGTNSTASTLYVGFNTRNYLLLDGSTGLIPDARLSSNILRSADLSGYATENWVGQQGYITSSALAPYALDTNVVHKTGNETISGTKTFTSTIVARDQLALACDDPSITKGTAPSTSKNTLIRFRDKNGANVGVLFHSYGTNKTSVVSMQAIKSNASSDTDYAQVSVYYPASGDPYATAPASDVNGSIVTTVNKSKSANGYFKLGNGLIVQWGTVSGTGGTVTLPTPFSNANYGVTFTRSAASGTNDNDAITARRATSFDVTIYQGGGGIWIAIGY